MRQRLSEGFNPRNLILIIPRSLLRGTNQKGIHPEGITAFDKKVSWKPKGIALWCDLGFNTPVTHRAGFELHKQLKTLRGLAPQK
jgi:hypothetical protein